jgi:large subunit ribosomal protein L19
MIAKLESSTKTLSKPELADIRPGDTVQVFQKIKEAPKKGKSSKEEGEKERIQIFEGVVLAKKHGEEAGATIIVRKVTGEVGIERTFPLHSPNIEKIETVKKGKVRRAKLYYLRGAKGRKARLKKKEAALVEDGKPKKELPKEEANKALDTNNKDSLEA